LKETLANRAGKAELSNEQAYATLRAWKDELDKTGTLEAGLND
jgi:hydroxyacylglutathione hydrolase